MGKMKYLRTAIIGAGGMGQGHCKTINSMVPEMKLVAVVDTAEEVARAAGVQFNVRYFTSAKALAKAKIADAAIIVTPHPFHHTAAIECMNAKLHVICEKPLSETVGSADKMIKAAKKNRVTFAIMFQRRAEPALAKAIELARTGKIGKIYRATMISPEYRSQAYYDSATWRATWKGEGGGVMMNQAPHIIDIFTLLAGLPESVRGYMETRMHRIEVEDMAEARLKYKDGGSGYFYCSTNEAGPGQMIEVFGDKGKLIWRDGVLEYYKFQPGIKEFTRKNKYMWGMPKCKKVEIKLKQRKAGHFRVMRNFARHILYKEALWCSGESGLASLELTNAIMLSAWKNKEVKLPINRWEYNKELERLRRTSTFKKGKTKDQRITDSRLA